MRKLAFEPTDPDCFTFILAKCVPKKERKKEVGKLVLDIVHTERHKEQRHSYTHEERKRREEKKREPS